ncbi:SusC/RagA family TonB-linked outer membrane protein [Aquimarina agarilytica]|uniref:SusC/RagA family TonB-linked outer membrane protein n=1 Tax=Aquimarina agarilytica TaxID=1087449 RepID=UPI000289C689|nr:SusC/RagA family TonB-linked outer membrane protein [Aquimarina agarilytica]
MKTFLGLLLLIFQISLAQNQMVSGVVYDNFGIPLPGVNVFIENKAAGTVTDFDGKFVIETAVDDTLIFSYIGFLTQKILVANNSIIDVKLLEDSESLEEVVVVAFGKQKKEEITGAVTTIKSAEVNQVQTANVIQGLTGKVAGVQIIQQNGQPGSGPSIRFRGIGSINSSSQALIVVDGAIYNGSISAIAPQDIESISFLKDASANALYGSRGANGVIIITTKKGKRGLSVSIDSKVGFNTRAVPEYDILSTPQEYYEAYYNRIRIGLINGGDTPEDAAKKASQGLIDGGRGLGYNNYNVPNDQLIDPTTGKLNTDAQLLYNDDWQKESFKTGVRTENYLSVRGASDKTSTFLSLGHLNDEGFAINSGFERVTARLSVDHTPKSWLKLGINANYARTQQDSPLLGLGSGAVSNLFGWARNVAPIYPVYGRDSKGNFVLDEAGNRQFDFGTGDDDFVGTRPSFTANTNPIATTLFGIGDNTFDNISGRSYLEFDFLKHFNFRYNYSIDIVSGNVTQFNTPVGGDAQRVNGLITSRATNGTTLVNQQLLNYKQDFNKHSISALIGHESTDYTFKYLAGQVTDVALPDTAVLDNGTNTQFLSGYEANYRVEGYLSRLTYDYDDKYFLNGSFRRDGSSVFASKNRWGNFYGLGVAWSVHKEAFIANVDWISILRLKASLGQQGNDALLYEQNRTSVGDRDNRNYFPFLDQFDIVNSGDGSPAASFFALGQVQGRESVVWETSTNINAGFELGLFSNKINLGVEYFERNVEDLLFYDPVSLSEGVGSIPSNVGDMENKGIEVELGANIISTPNVDLSVNINATHFKNKVTKLPDEFIDSGIFRLQEGKSRYDYFTRLFAGVNPDTGAAIWFTDELDANTGNPTGNRITTEDGATATEYFVGKSAIPDVYGGFSTSFRCKQFLLDIGFAYQIGGYGYDGIYQDLLGNATSPGNNLHRDVVTSTWTPERKSAPLPRIDTTDNDQTTTSDLFLVDASYLSLQNVSLGYNLPKEILSVFKLTSAKIYVAANNVFLWTKTRKGYDPRLSVTGNAINEYSLVRATSLGLTLNF